MIDCGVKYIIAPQRVRRPANPFRVQRLFDVLTPGLSLRSNPGLKLANAFGVFIQFRRPGEDFPMLSIQIYREVGHLRASVRTSGR